MSDSLSKRLIEKVREMPDFPKPGLVYRDITAIVTDGELFKEVVDALAEQYAASPPDLICGVEARGYIFGAALAYRMGLGFLPIRWEGKLPPDRTRQPLGTLFEQLLLLTLDALVIVLMQKRGFTEREMARLHTNLE